MINIQVVRSKKKNFDKDGDFDDKAQIIQLEVVIDNNDLRNLEGFTAHLNTIGQVMDDELLRKNEDVYVVLDKQSLKFDLQSGIDIELETKPISVRFDESSAARFGARYEGYTVTVTDAKNNIIYRYSDKRRFRDHVEKIEKFAALDQFDEDIQPVKNSSTSIQVNK